MPFSTSDGCAAALRDGNLRLCPWRCLAEHLAAARGFLPWFCASLVRAARNPSLPASCNAACLTRSCLACCLPSPQALRSLLLSKFFSSLVFQISLFPNALSSIFFPSALWFFKLSWLLFSLESLIVLADEPKTRFINWQ